MKVNRIFKIKVRGLVGRIILVFKEKAIIKSRK